MDANNPQPSEQARKRPLPPVETRFKKGQSGNPSGRPKRPLVTTQLIRILSRKDKTGRSYAEAVAAGLIKELTKGKNVKELLDRIEGPVAGASDDVSTTALNAVAKLLERLDADAAPQSQAADNLESD